MISGRSCSAKLVWKKLRKTGYILPKPSLITEPKKTAYMISISGMGVCGGNDFWRPRSKEDGLSAGKSGGHQVEKSQYGMDNKILP
jgi:hypothetical protein